METIGTPNLAHLVPNTHPTALPTTILPLYILSTLSTKDTPLPTLSKTTLPPHPNTPKTITPLLHPSTLTDILQDLLGTQTLSLIMPNLPPTPQLPFTINRPITIILATLLLSKVELCHQKTLKRLPHLQLKMKMLELC